MQAHRVRVTIPEDHKVTIDVPAEVPTGDAEVIVLSSGIRGPAPACRHNLRRAFSSEPGVGPIIFHEDPTLPVSEEDWPSESAAALFLLGARQAATPKSAKARATESGAREALRLCLRQQHRAIRQLFPRDPTPNPK